MLTNIKNLLLKPNKVLQSIYIIVFRVLLDYMYYNIVSPLYSYIGMTAEQSTFYYMVSWIMVICYILMMFTIIDVEKNGAVEAPIGNVSGVEFYYFLEICDVTSSAYLPHTGEAWLDGETFAVVEFVFLPLVHCRWSCSYKTHISSLCQLRNNFFSKISHKAQYYQLTLKISTKKEPLISQKSQTLRFYLYSISPNCTILA